MEHRLPTGTGAQPLRFALFDDVPHAMSTRLGGVSPHPYASLNLGMSTLDAEHRVLENRRRFLGTLGITREDVHVARLSHGAAVSVFRSGDSHRSTSAPVRKGSQDVERVFFSDAVVSNRPGFFALLTFADCVPLAFYDRNRGVVGAAHAGWRGTALGIAPRVVLTMVREFGSRPGDIVVGIGPSIGSCCYEVGADVIDRFKEHDQEPAALREGDRFKVDLWETNARQLRDAGIPNGSIDNPRLCTSCSVSRFFSHRAENGTTGRGALCIGVPR